MLFTRYTRSHSKYNYFESSEGKPTIRAEKHETLHQIKLFFVSFSETFFKSQFQKLRYQDLDEYPNFRVPETDSIPFLGLRVLI